MENFSRPEPIIIINCVLNTLMVPVAIIGNALILIALKRTPSIHSPSMLILGGLAVSDLVVGIFVQPFYVAKELTENQLLSVVWDTAAYPVCGVSLLVITASSVDRYLALHYHLRYSILVTNSRVIFTTVVIWLFNYLSSLFYFWSQLIYHLILAVNIGTCLIISTFCYVKIYQIVRRHHRQIRAQQRAVESSYTNNMSRMMDLKKSAINHFLIYTCMVICYMPLYILLTLHATHQSYKLWKNEWNFATTLVLMNSSINPFLYCWRIGELRRAVVTTAKEMLCWKVSERVALQDISQIKMIIETQQRFWCCHTSAEPVNWKHILYEIFSVWACFFVETIRSFILYSLFIFVSLYDKVVGKWLWNDPLFCLKALFFLVPALQDEA